MNPMGCVAAVLPTCRVVASVRPTVSRTVSATCNSFVGTSRTTVMSPIVNRAACTVASLVDATGVASVSMFMVPTVTAGVDTIGYIGLSDFSR